MSFKGYFRNILTPSGFVSVGAIPFKVSMEAVVFLYFTGF